MAPGHSNINKLRRNIYVFYLSLVPADKMSKPGSGCTLEAEWRSSTHRVGSEGYEGEAGMADLQSKAMLSSL